MDQTIFRMKRFALCTLRFGAGVDIRRFYVGVAYDLGVTNLARTGDKYRWSSGTKIRTGSILVSVGYNF